MKEAEVDIVVFEAAPPSSLGGSQGKEAAVGQGADIVVPESTTGHFAPHALNGNAQGEPVELTLLQPEGGDGVGGQAHRAIFKNAILDPMGRADMKRSMVERVVLEVTVRELKSSGGGGASSSELGVHGLEGAVLLGDVKVVSLMVRQGEGA